MILSTILISLIFISYNLAMHKKFGRLQSVSAGTYKLEPLKLGWIFSSLLLAILMYMVTMTMLTDNWLFFLAAAGAGFTGTARLFHDKRNRLVHYIGSAGMISSASVACWVSFGHWWTVAGVAAFAILGFIFRKKIENPVYWVEIAAFTLIILGIVL